MSTFLRIALRNAARGFRVHPLRGKDAFLKDWPNIATTDEAQIRAWAEKFPDYNVGVAGGPDVCIVDSDRVSRLKELSAEHAPEWFHTFSVTSGRPDRAHFYYRMTDGARELGNKTWAEKSIKGNVFELKVHGGQVVAEGSIHPDTGNVYQIVQDLPLIPLPVGLLALMRECLGKDANPRERVPREPVREGGRHSALVSEAGRILRVTEMSKHVLTAHLQDFNEQWLDPPLADEEVERIANSCNWLPEPPPAEVFIVGSKPTEDLEEVEELDQNLRATPLPPYPADVWEGTLYMDFAKNAAEGNFVPLEFFIEGAMTYAGAMVGENLCGMSEEITPRLYTVLLALAGLGKGTTFRRLRKIAPPQRMLDAVTESNVPRTGSSVALLARAGSEPALNDALLAWKCVCLDFEEMDKLFEKTRIKDSGAALMSVIRTCFDDVVPGITTTSKRTVVAPIAYLSLLGAMTPSLWRRAMEGQDSYGSGLGGRFNLVATNEDRTAATLLPMNVDDLQGALDGKLAELERNALTIPTERAALDVLAEWWAQSKGQAHFNRVNVIAHRKALHLAWMRGLPVITRETMVDALKLADYLVAVRDAFAVTKGEDRTAIGENRVMHVLKQIAPKWVSSKKVVELLDGLMSRASVFRALESLVNSAEAEKQTVKRPHSRPYAVYRVSLT